MKKLLIIFFFLFFLSNNALANQEIVNSLKSGGKLVFIRHTLAPGGGDPVDFDIKDCLTQRNLSSTGITQAKIIGKFFKDSNIPIDQVLSSEWCRCKDTAQNAFENYQTFNALNSFFSSKFVENREEQMKDLRAFVKNWNSKKNIVFVTHYVVISEILGTTAIPGEIIVADKNFKVIGAIETN